MLRKVMLLTVAAVAMCSCEITDGDSVKRTLPGYIMYLNTVSGYNELAGKLELAFKIDEYLAASTDEERNALHDKYFYSNYVAYDAETGVLNIRYPSYDLFVYTGGKLLSEDGAVWRGNYSDGNPYKGKDSFPTFTRLEDGRYKVEYEILQDYDRPAASICVEMTVEEPQYAADDRIVRISGSDKSEYLSSYNGKSLVIDDEVSDLTWNGYAFIGGRFAMTTTNDGVTDTASAIVVERMGVEIEYRGVKEKYQYYD